MEKRNQRSRNASQSDANDGEKKKRPLWARRTRRSPLRAMRNLRKVRLRAVIPNLCTLGCAWSGMTAIRSASEGQIEVALYAIIVAALFDVLDGLLARNLNVSSDFGAVLDSLADFVSFAVAPAMILYYWGDSTTLFIWPACLFYAACGAMRLARFSISMFNATDQDVNTRFFFGVPSPMGAFLVLIPVASQLFWKSYLDADSAGAVNLEGLHHLFQIPMLLLVGIMMISTIPTFSSKNIMVMGRNRILVWVAALLLIFGIIENIWLTWVVACMLYIVTIGITVRLYRDYVRKNPVRGARQGKANDSDDREKRPN